MTFFSDVQISVMSVKPAIAYLRVSTQSQEHHGSGLDLQRTRIDAYAREAGYTIVDVFKDAQSGFDDKPGTRPGLVEALKRAMRSGHPIIVDGLSRISRETEKLERILSDHRIKVVSATSGEGAGRAVIMGEAARARAEGERIRATTKEGLARARERGAKFGNPTNLPEAQEKGSAANRTAAEGRAEQLVPIIDQLRQAGKRTKREIAEALNEQGLRTSRGERWNENNIRRALARTEAVRDQDQEPNLTRRNPSFGMFA